MVDDRTSAESFNNEVLVLTSSVILDGNLNYSILDQVKAVSEGVFLAEESPLLVSMSLHTVDQLLFRQQAQVLEVRNLLHLMEEPRGQRVLVLKDLLLEQIVE